MTTNVEKRYLTLNEKEVTEISGGGTTILRFSGIPNSSVIIRVDHNFYTHGDHADFKVVIQCTYPKGNFSDNLLLDIQKGLACDSSTPTRYSRPVSSASELCCISDPDPIHNFQSYQLEYISFGVRYSEGIQKSVFNNLKVVIGTHSGMKLVPVY